MLWSTLSATVFDWFSQQFQELVETDESPHGLPAVVEGRRIDRPSCHWVHLFWAGPVGVHAGSLRSFVHGGQLCLRHSWISGHEIDSLKDANAPTLKALELDGLRVFTRVQILLNVYNVVREFHSKTFFAKNSLWVIRIHSPEQEIVGSVGDRAFVPREGSRIRSGPLDAEIIDPSLATLSKLKLKKTKIVSKLWNLVILRKSNLYARTLISSVVS